VAAYLYVIPTAEICIFSPSRRQSEKMLELVKTFLTKLPGASDRIVKANRERLWLRGDAHRAEDLRKCSSYPSKVSTLKGVGGDLIICEEVRLCQPPCVPYGRFHLNQGRFMVHEPGNDRSDRR